MKVLHIAFKDLLRSFRSLFLLTMMFVAPLLLTGLIYFAFGSAGSGLELPVTRVWAADLDQPDSQSGLSAGQMLVDYLQGEALADLLQVTVAPDEASARAAVEHQEADVAVIIPPGLTAAAMTPGITATVTLYHDPTLTVQPGIVRVVAGGFLDGFSGVKIALEVAARRLKANGLALDPPTAEQIEQDYIAWVQSSSHTHDEDGTTEAALTLRAPAEAQAVDVKSGLIGRVMGGMIIFFAFFTGASTASSLVHEDEEGTLARLFTTPTPPAAVLGGKFVAVFMTVIVQVVVLLVAAHFIFGINWGQPLTVAPVVVGLVVAASGFGVFLMSFIKTARQTGPVLGGVVSVTGLLGGLLPTGNPNTPTLFDTLGLALPQGWALRGLRLALGGAQVGEALLPVAVLVAVGLALFVAGVLGFRRRFAA